MAATSAPTVRTDEWSTVHIHRCRPAIPPYTPPAGRAAPALVRKKWVKLIIYTDYGVQCASCRQRTTGSTDFCCLSPRSCPSRRECGSWGRAANPSPTARGSGAALHAPPAGSGTEPPAAQRFAFILRSPGSLFCYGKGLSTSAEIHQSGSKGFTPLGSRNYMSRGISTVARRVQPCT